VVMTVSKVKQPFAQLLWPTEDRPETNVVALRRDPSKRPHVHGIRRHRLCVSWLRGRLGVDRRLPAPGHHPQVQSFAREPVQLAGGVNPAKAGERKAGAS